MAFGAYCRTRSVRTIFAYPLRMIFIFVTTYAITMKGSVAAASHQDSRIAHPAAVTNRVRRLRRKGASEADDMMKKHRRDIERDYPLPALRADPNYRAAVGCRAMARMRGHILGQNVC